MTKFLILFLAAALPAAAHAASGELVWEFSQGLAQPESAWYDKSSKSLYISNVAGNPAEKDGNGWILKANLKGEVIEEKWVTGLHAPKGLRSRGNRLYVADIDRLVLIDIKRGRVISRLRAPGAKMLNDVAIASNGDVYVSDTLASRIYRFPKKGDPEIFAEGKVLDSPNGLYLKGRRLYIASWGLAAADWSTKKPGRLLVLDIKTKEVTKVKGPSGHLDGLEPWKNGWFVSDFSAGKIFWVDRDGKFEVWLEGFKGSADFGIVPRSKILILPRMQENLVSAYSLKKSKKDRRGSPALNRPKK